MSSRVTYRERETDREWEEKPRRTYTTIKRYQVPDTVSRSSYQESEDVKDKVIIKRSSRHEPSRDKDQEEIDVRVTERVREAPREDYAYRVTERVRERGRGEEEDFRFSERVVESDRQPRRDITYRVIERDSDRVSRSGRSDHRSETKTVERERVKSRSSSSSSSSREHVREFRFERERSFSPPERGERHRDYPYDVERYSKNTEYYVAPQPAPQPIIIRESVPQPQVIIREERREGPVIIREIHREPRYEFIEREEKKEDTQALVKREETPPPAPESVKSEKPEPKQEEEDYYFERRIREYDRRRDDRHSDVHPKESASNYSSDDSYEYYRGERTYEGRDSSPHHRRHLLEGVAAGVGAAEIIRHHRQAEGKAAGGRFKSAAGGAIVGAVGAEALTRLRSRSRRGDRTRSLSDDGRGHRRHRRHRPRSYSRSRSRSRSKSLSRRQLGGLAAVAGVAALAGYALNNRNKNQETIVFNDPPPHRSRSRRRRRSHGGYTHDQRDTDDARDPDHRNRRIAQVGLASAAAAGLVERMRSKSRGKSRHRSRSRIATGVPIAAAGLGGAALAGLYEKNKASKAAKRDAMIEDELGRGRRRRSRSRDRSVNSSAPYDDPRGGPPVDDRGMIAYGDEPIYPDQSRDLSSDGEPGHYRRRHGAGGSAGSSPDTRRRSRSRRRDYTEAGAAGGMAGVAAHEAGRDRDYRDGPPDDRLYDNGHGPYSPPPQPGYLPPQDQSYPPAENFGPQQSGYPHDPYFPPPPTGENLRPGEQPYPEQGPNPYPVYNPADYAASGPNYAQPNTFPTTRDIHAEGAAPGTNYATDEHASHSPRAERHDSRRNNPENVSASHQLAAERYEAPSVADAGVDDESERGRRHGAAQAGTSSYHAQAGDEQNHNIESSRLTRVSSDGVNPAAASPDGQRTPRARSTSRVRFDLEANEMHSPDKTRRRSNRDPSSERSRFSDSDYSVSDQSPRHARSSRSNDDHHQNERGRARRSRSYSPPDSPSLMHDQYDRAVSSQSSRRRGNANDEDDSEGTIELPPRFDQNGNRRPEHGDLGDTIAELLLGRSGSGGGLLSSLLGGGGTSGDRGSSGRDTDSGRGSVGRGHRR